MAARQRIALALISILACMGASYQTQNFVVHAPTPEIAKSVGQWAEHYRREKAVQWLGREMPNWSQPCPLHVKVTMSGPSGATSFNFGRDRFNNGMVLGQRMEINGPLDRLIASVLPHEITHTVFAYHFKCPVPRWADEGGSVLSEDDIERERHDQLVRQILTSGQQIRMRTLFGLTEYPRNVMALYAQGYSIADYLVKRSDRQTFLNFVAHGMNQGWDNAVWTYYRHRTVEELEGVWLQYLRETRNQPHIQVAQGRQAAPAPRYEQADAGDQAPGTVVRLTVPPSPLASADPYPPAVARGAMPTAGQVGQTFGDGFDARPAASPRYLPEAGQGWHAPTQDFGEQPQTPQYDPVPVQLGPPQFAQQMQPGTVPQGVSPVGFPGGGW